MIQIKIKKKDFFAALVSIAFAVIIIGGCVFLTKRHNNTELSPPIRSVDVYNVCLADEKALRDSVDVSGYVYGSDYILYPGNTENGIEYFTCFIFDRMKTLFFKRNTVNGNLARLDLELDYAVPYIYAADGFIYYLKIKNDDYSVNYLCRIPTSGGGEQMLAEYDIGKEYYADLHFAVEGKVILSFSEKLFAYDIIKNETRVLWDAEKNGFDLLKTNVWYYGGNLYFSAITETLEDVIPTDVSVTDSMIPVNSEYLLTLNMKTKKSSLLVKEPITCFYITEDEIIYMPKVHRTVEIRGQIMPHYNDKIISCDHDGKNPREIFSGLDFWAYTIYRYRDGKIYVNDGYAETFKQSIIEIDTTTGKASVYEGWSLYE